MTNRIYIGIDGGRDTGVAVWNSRKKEFHKIITTDFWGAIDTIETFNQHMVTHPGLQLIVVIENPAGNAPVFKMNSVYDKTNGAHGKKLGAAGFLASSVGSVKRESELIIEYCKRKGIEHRAITPGKRSMTKLTTEAFTRYTGYNKRTSQHGRDAAMLVYSL